MPFVRHFLLGAENLGSAEDSLRFIHGEAQQPQPYAMFCPGCGEVWARMPVSGSNREWHVVNRHCEAHPGPSRYIVHGSLISNWEPELTAIFPDEVIKREFELHLRLWDSMQNE